MRPSLLLLLLALCAVAAPALAEEGQVDAVAAEIAPEPLEFFSQDPPPPAAPPASEIDMTAFQDAYDRELAEAQEAAGADPDANRNSGRERIGDRSLTGLMAQTVVALLVICALIIAFGWLARKFGARTPLLAGANLAQVLGRTYLEPKTALHFVKTGGRVLVVGVTPNSISLLTEFDAEQFELAGTGAPAAARTPPADFLTQLREQQERTDAAPPPAPDEDLDALRGDIQRLKQYLQDSRRGSGI